MTKSKQRLLAIDGVEHRVNEYMKAEPSYVRNMTQRTRDRIHKVYERAVWIDSQLSGSCIVDPFFWISFLRRGRCGGI